MSNGELSARPGESPADFKARIEARIAEKQAATPPSPPPKAPEPPIDAAVQKPNMDPAPAPNPAPPAASKPPAAQPDPANATLPDGKQVDLREWARNKGIKDEESALRALRSLETEFHKRNQDRGKSLAPTAPQADNPPPTFTPTPAMPNWTPQPAMPSGASFPQPPIQREQVIAELARQYNMPPEDFERIHGLASDIAGAEIRRVTSELQRQWNQEMGGIKRENQRNSEIRRLMADPDFSDPEVQFEMHRILEENPQAFSVEPAPYTWAFNQAVNNMGRKFLQGNRKTSDSNQTPPSRPPLTAGGGQGSATPAPEVTPQHFADMPLEKKRELLTSIGARPAL